MASNVKDKKLPNTSFESNNLISLYKVSVLPFKTLRYLTSMVIKPIPMVAKIRSFTITAIRFGIFLIPIPKTLNTVPSLPFTKSKVPLPEPVAATVAATVD